MDIDATKTPRTYAAWKKSYDVQELAKLMVELSQQLEAELNTAIVNESIAENKVYMLEKQLKENQERIDQLVLFNNQLSDINVQVSQERDDLNVRIKRLEEQLMDSKNKYAVLVADVVLNEDRADRIKQLEEALLGTIDWITETIETGDVGYKGADEISEIIAAKLALRQPVIRQYYYKQNTCNAESARSPDCICWHDEGTGPCNNDYFRSNKLEWRIKPKAKL